MVLLNTDRTQIPGSSGPRPYEFPQLQRFTLANGLRVVLLEKHNIPLIDTWLYSFGGGVGDLPGFEGDAELRMRLLSEGTKKRNSVQIANDLESLGAWHISTSGWSGSNMLMRSTQRNYAEALEIYFDLICNSIFPEAELARKRKELQTEFIQSKDSAEYQAGFHFARQLFDGSRFGVPINGNEETIGRLSREHLLQSNARLLAPGNSILVITGDVTRAEIEKLVEPLIRDWNGGEPFVYPTIEHVAPAGVQILIVDKPGSAQVALRMGHRGMDRRSPDYFAVTVMNLILGGYFSSRLNLNLREDKGWTYGVTSTFQNRKNIGPFLVSASLQTEHAGESVDEIRAAMTKLKKEPVSTEELNSAKGYLNGSFPLRHESGISLTSSLIDTLLFDLPEDYFRKYRENILQVSAADVQRVAEKYLQPDNLYAVLVGPAEQLIDQFRGYETVKSCTIDGEPYHSV
jgi:zinc protease